MLDDRREAYVQAPNVIIEGQWIEEILVRRQYTLKLEYDLHTWIKK